MVDSSNYYIALTTTNIVWNNRDFININDLPLRSSQVLVLNDTVISRWTTKGFAALLSP